MPARGARGRLLTVRQNRRARHGARRSRRSRCQDQDYPCPGAAHRRQAAGAIRSRAAGRRRRRLRQAREPRIQPGNGVIQLIGEATGRGGSRRCRRPPRRKLVDLLGDAVQPAMDFGDVLAARGQRGGNRLSHGRRACLVRRRDLCVQPLSERHSGRPRCALSRRVGSITTRRYARFHIRSGVRRP